jgi:hypothetical protein
VTDRGKNLIAFPFFTLFWGGLLGLAIWFVLVGEWIGAGAVLVVLALESPRMATIAARIQNWLRVRFVKPS